MSHDPALHPAPGNNGNTGNGPGEAPEAFASLKRLALSALIAGVALYLVTGVAYQASLSSDSPARHTAQQRFATAFREAWMAVKKANTARAIIAKPTPVRARWGGTTRSPGAMSTTR